jgi:hypothetical protein
MKSEQAQIIFLNEIEKNTVTVAGMVKDFIVIETFCLNTMTKTLQS